MAGRAVTTQSTPGLRPWPTGLHDQSLVNTMTSGVDNRIDNRSAAWRPSAVDAILLAYTGRGADVTGLPQDLQAQSAQRLRIVAILYAFVFFTSGPLTAAVFTEDRTAFLSSFIKWGPSAMSITAALLVAALTFHRRIAVGTVLGVGLLFEVVGSVGIAAAQYLDATRYASMPPWAGLSWVAVWMLSFTVMIPSPPCWTLWAALASAATVPAVVGFVIVTQDPPIDVTPLRFFLLMVLPYLLVVLIAYVGARVVYRLGTELTRARELGAYRLVECLERGGMGEVWRAQHRLLARPAAVKLMRREGWDSDPTRRAELHARFEREAQATSSLRSPHTVQLYDFGVADDGTFYYVMELRRDSISSPWRNAAGRG